MVREVVISAYLFLFQIIFTICKVFPQKKKTVCVTSFGDNVYYTIRALRSISDEEIIILKDRSCRYPFTIGRIIPFDIVHPIAYVRSIYHLATATTILVDNYFGFLAASKFKAGTTCIQLWHAVGAIKKFGLQDPSVKSRHPIAKNRFLKVYNRFHYTIVGSNKMANVFEESFGISPSSILTTGIPRTDIFFDQDEMKKLSQKMERFCPSINDRKVILYAPTFRHQQLTNYQLAFDLKKLHDELKDDYILFIKQHPSVSYTLHEKYEDFVYDVSNYYDTNHLFLITDLLITDYSSVSFEFALLEKPIIFYAYDKQTYEETSGLIDNYDEVMPGPVLETTDDLIQAIKSQKYDKSRIESFAKDWNEYSNGNSSMNVAKFVVNKAKKRQESTSYK